MKLTTAGNITISGELRSTCFAIFDLEELDTPTDRKVYEEDPVVPPLDFKPWMDPETHPGTAPDLCLERGEVHITFDCENLIFSLEFPKSQTKLDRTIEASFLVDADQISDFSAKLNLLMSSFKLESKKFQTLEEECLESGE